MFDDVLAPDDLPLVPLPAAVWFLAAGIGGLAVLRPRRVGAAA